MLYLFESSACQNEGSFRGRSPQKLVAELEAQFSSMAKACVIVRGSRKTEKYRMRGHTNVKNFLRMKDVDFVGLVVAVAVAVAVLVMVAGDVNAQPYHPGCVAANIRHTLCSLTL